MNNSPGNQKSSFFDTLLRLLGLSKPAGTPLPGKVVVPPDSATEPARIITAQVLLVVYDPVMDSAGTKLSEKMNWNRPEDLANTYIQDLLEVSGGLARYEIVQRAELDEFPALTDGFRYTPQTFLPVWNRAQPAHQPQYVDYQAILTGLNVMPRVIAREIDEVWLMGFPYAGFYESTMCGAGAFWCNSQPQAWSSGCPRRFVVMGFNYERGVGEMLHSFGHRCEFTLDKTFSGLAGAANLFKQFALYDLVSPGQAELGSVHFPPNAEKEYDYNHPRTVMSNCDDWLNFPNFKNEVRLVNADEWGNGDLRLLHKWWLKHLPKVAGRINGIANNWWQYSLDPNLINL